MNIFNKKRFYAIFRGDLINRTIKTVALVTIFSCAERCVGFLYRIFLSRNLTAEFIGIYQVTLSVVGVLVTLSASGIPITVSRLMVKERASGNLKGEKDVVSAGILSSLILSLPVTLILYFFKDKLSFIFADERCYELLLVILPGVVITSVYAVIRGYFWGNKNFFTYSLIEFLEEIVMCVVGIILIKLTASPFGKAISAAKSVLISYVFSFVLSTSVFLLKSGKPTNPIYKLKPVLKSSSPITAMRTLTSFLGSLIAIILPSRLVDAGIDKSVAMQSFGELSGMALPLLFIPSTVIGSIALVIVPKLSENYYKNQKDTLNYSIERAFDYSMLIAVIIVPMFICCGNEIGKIVYANENAGHYLAVSAFIMVPMSITMITNSILNSLNKEKATLVNFLIGAAAMILSVCFLTKKLNVYSLIVGYFLSYVLTGTLNFAMLSKITLSKKTYIKKICGYIVSLALATLFGYFSHGIFVGKISDFFVTAIVCIAIFLFEVVFIQLTSVFDFTKILK